jgi:hypothetical protein
MTIVDAEPLKQEFPVAERARRVFEQIGSPLEVWEALALTRSEGSFLRQELDRMDGLLRAGRVARPGQLLHESIGRLRQSHARLARALRHFLAGRRDDAAAVEDMIAVALLHPERRRAAERWIAENNAPEERLQALADVAARCRGAEPAVPQGVDADLYRDLLATRDFLQTFAGPAKVELWEVMSLALQDRDAVRLAAARLAEPRAQAVADDVNAVTIRVLEKLLDIRFRWTPLVRALAGYVRALPTGRYGGETLDLAIGFLVASPEGRERARAWIEDPRRFRREAALRLEGVIGRAQKYLVALRAVA